MMGSPTGPDRSVVLPARTSRVGDVTCRPNPVSLIAPSSAAVVEPSTAVAEEWVPAGAELHRSKLPHENVAGGPAAFFAVAARTTPSAPTRHSPVRAAPATPLLHRV